MEKLDILVAKLAAPALSLIVSWTAAPQCRDSLEIDAGFGWSPVPVIPLTVGDRCHVEVPADLSHAFFRVGREWSPAATVTCAWEASTTLTVTEYVLYSSPNRMGAWTAVGTVPAAELTLTTSLFGPQCFFYVTARTDSGLESDPSNMIPSPLPPIPSDLMITKKPAELVSRLGRWITNKRNVLTAPLRRFAP